MRMLHSPSARSRPAALLLVVLLTSTSVAPPVAAYHDYASQNTTVGADAPDPIRIVVDEARNTSTGYPTLDWLRDEILERHQGVVEEINRQIITGGANATSYVPALPARVMEDAFDDGRRVGGIGDWRVVGDHWRLDPTIGTNHSAAWTMSNATTGRYETMDALLVSPAIDLSAYVHQAGAYPFVGRDFGTQANMTCTAASDDAIGRFVSPFLQRLIADQCPTLTDVGSTAQVTRDQVTLIFRHRYNLTEGFDGAQVRVFTRPPAPGAVGALVKPLPAYGNYSEHNLQASNERGFTGTSDGWQIAAFDLTPWSGTTVWLGFRVTTSPKASGGLDEASDKDPRGWIVDDVEVVAPAYAYNVKAYDLVTSPFKADPEDRFYTVAARRNATFEATILHAAGTSREVRATFRIEGLDNGILEKVVSRNLTSGEIWNPNLTLPIDADEGAFIKVSVQADTVGPDGNGTLRDPTEHDNLLTRRYQVLSVARFDVRLDPSKVVVDDNEDTAAIVMIRNTGNVPVQPSVVLRESYLDAPAGTSPRHVTISHGTKSAFVDVGAEERIEWSVTSSVRGAHNISVVAEMPGAPTVRTNTTYFVHASPPPIFLDMGGEPSPGWETYSHEVPIPELDDAMWVAEPIVDTAGVILPGPQVLRALATPEILAMGDEARFKDLRLTVNYMMTGPATQEGPLEVHLAYATPPVGVGRAGSSLSSSGTNVAGDFDEGLVTYYPGTAIVWGYAFSAFIGNPDWSSTVKRDMSRTWRAETVDVDPRPSKGYADLWAAQGLQVLILAPEKDRTVYLDDLRLTGVPVGGDEAQRVDIVRVTGEEDATDTTVQYYQPSRCVGESGVGDPRHCWRPWTRADAFDKRRLGEWRSESDGVSPTLDGTPALWRYSRDPGVAVPASRLLTPVLTFTGASDPVLTFEHEYAFNARPKDGLASASMQILHFGHLTLQYKKDDGTWSRFHRLVPVGDYPHPLRFNSWGDERPVVPNSYGFYFPTDCVWSVLNCYEGGYIDNLGRIPTKAGDLRQKLLIHYRPTPYSPPVDTFLLNPQAQPDLDVDLRDREVRVAFQVPEFPSGGNEREEWTVGNVRIVPMPTFAIDAAVENVSFAVPYDVARIGLGPGTAVPINVTVRNVGEFIEDFSVRINASLLGGNESTEWPVPIGTLAPGESKSVHVRWDVPDVDERRAYRISATAFLTATGEADDNFLNDHFALGEDASVFAERRLDAAVRSVPYPATGRETLARHVPTTVLNLGNVPLEGVEVVRTIERLTGGDPVLVREDRWDLLDPVEPDPVGVSLRRIRTDPETRPEDDYLTPGVSGTFVLSVRLELPSGADDVNPDDNEARAIIRSREALAFDDFEERSAWTTNDADVWGSGEGFRSARGLLAANRTSGAIPPGTDAWVMSPKLPLASAQAAVVNMFMRHDLEPGYDGGVLEASVDGGVTWATVPPADERNRAKEYPVPLVNSNPFAMNASPNETVRAFSGDTRQASEALDGWVPASFNLGEVPGFTERVVIHEFRAPDPSPETVRLAPTDLPPAPWMVEDSKEDDARWEVRDETGHVRARQGTMWWSQTAAVSGKQVHTLSRTFTLQGASEVDTLELSWWEWRSGSTENSWRGVGGEYWANVTQVGSGGTMKDVTKGSPEVLERRGPWTHLRVLLKEVNPQSEVTVQFQFTSQSVTIANLGWAVEDILFRAVDIVGGVVTTKGTAFTGDDDSDATNWTSDGWIRVERIPSRPAQWKVDVVDKDGFQHPRWNLTLEGNNDTRLVTPAIDLSRVGGAEAYLSLRHRHDFSHVFDVTTAIHSSRNWTFGKHAQAGVVEVQVYNETTGTWDPWRQLFGDAEGPTRSLAPRLSNGVEPAARPYTVDLPDVGDSFERYPREAYVKFTSHVSPALTDFHWNRKFEVDTSYAFSGRTPGTGTETSDFDLSPYLGQRVRFAFHAWSSPLHPNVAKPYWYLDEIAVVADTLRIDDAFLRFRLGTDASVLAGSWDLDQFEVTGLRYSNSIGIRIEDQPTRVSSDGVATIRGTIKNYGPTAREFVGVGIRTVGTPLEGVTVSKGTSLPAGEHAARAGPFHLAPAGQPNSTAEFEFLAYPGPPGSRHIVTLEVIEAKVQSGSLDYGVVEDDIPGGARRTWALSVADTLAMKLSPVDLDPPFLAAPGEVRAYGELQNVGTRPLSTNIIVQWFGQEGALLATSVLTGGAVAPGGTLSYTSEPFLATEVGNYSVRVTATAVGGGSIERFADARFRVGTSDVALLTDFETGGFEGWSATEGFRVETGDGDAAFGRASVLFGVNNTEYDAGERAQGGGQITSPPVDLRSVGANASIKFWHKPRLGSSSMGFSMPNLTVSHAPLGSAFTCAEAFNWKVLNPNNLSLNLIDWEFVSLPLDSTVTGRIGCFKFSVENAMDQGWRLDAVTVSGGDVVLAPDAQSHVVTDSAIKEYRFLVSNRGLAEKQVRLGMDPRLSAVTEAQATWVSLDRDHLTVPPGGNATVVVRVETPAAAGAYSQRLRIALSATDVLAPFTSRVGILQVDFRPLPRSDISLSVAADGRPLGSERVELEELVPHQISITARNLGFIDSRPTEVRLEIVDDATGAVVWEYDGTIKPIEPSSSSDDFDIVSATWKPDFDRRGNYTLRVVADPQRLQVDYDRRNDDLRLPIKVVRLIRPDLVVDSRSVFVSTPDGERIFEAVPGELLRIEGTVRNEGSAEATEVIVRLLAGTAVLKEEIVPKLAPGGSYTVRATQFAPDGTTAYRVMAVTSSMELFATNNEHTISLPIFPPEIVFDVLQSPIDVEPGVGRVVPVVLRNTGPYPVVLNLSVSGAARFATFSLESVALGPNERREIDLFLDPARQQAAGEWPLVMRANTPTEALAQKTLPIRVTSAPAAEFVTYLARGPPDSVRVDLDAVNAGNVPLKPVAVLRSETGLELNRADLPEIRPGGTRFTTLKLNLDPSTPPGVSRATLTLEAEGEELARRDVDIQVLRWGRVDSRVAPLEPEGEKRQYAVTLEYEGNAPARRAPTVLGGPPGVVARFSEPIVELRPGESRNLTMTVESPRGIPSGLYDLQMVFLDPEPEAASVIDVSVLSNSIPVPLDLRTARVELRATERIGAHELRSGDLAVYTATIRNVGDRSAASFPVDLYVDGRLVAREVVDDLAPGASREVRLEWESAPGRHAVALAIDPHGPLAGHADGFAEVLQVETKLSGGASAATRDIPGVSLVWSVAVFGAALALVRRGDAPRARR